MAAEPPHEENPESLLWDVIVVGTGMGGSTLGYSLASAGYRVLFLEKGKSTLPDATNVIRDHQPEITFTPEILRDPSAMRDAFRRGGRCVDEIEDVTKSKAKRFTPFIGNGTGGSSALYGMVCERLFPADFAPRSNFPGARETTIPEAWPVSYEEMRPWYEAAERLYRVRGTPDPLRPEDAHPPLLTPAPLTPGNAELSGFLAEQGKHPYQLHVACEYLPDCQSCQSYLCARGCKNDASKICLIPALQQQGAQLLDECTVTAIEANRTKADRVICRWRGREIALRGKYIVLAAGALVTPVLLLQSKSADWPNGLGNDCDLVGRNLMRHCIDLYMIWPKLNQPITGQVKELGFNDFYHADGLKMGTVQSAGASPPVELLLHQPDLGAAVLRRFGRPLKWLWERFIFRGIALAAIMEDLPYHDNRILPGAAGEDGAPGIRLQYRFRDQDKQRAREFRSRVSRTFKQYRPLPIHGGADNKPIAHVCGTCRFGNDPKTSVLDASNRVHGLDNLYVADTSFFPSSGGLNPSLTVAANALRVGAILRERLG